MQISVILCTYNRCQTLRQALESMAAQVFREPVEWEVLVVDNNSSDGTREVVEAFCSRYPGRFRYCFEPEPGLSYARNAGIRQVRGNIVAFTDDDIKAEATWLQNLTLALRQSGEWAGAGGRILPDRNFSAPRWLSVGRPYALAPLALFEPGSKAGPLAEPPFGANMAFRRSMFERYGDFRTDLGRRPGILVSNEDTEFGNRLLAHGERFYYEPSAVIYHPVSVERMRKSYFLAWWLAKGRSDMREFGVRPNKYYFCGIPLYLVRNLIGCTLRWMLGIRPGDRFLNRRTVWYKIGQLYEFYRPYIAPQNGRAGSANGDAKPFK
jgi:glucosyl-dolichyl phosphate glucuronosyltransferase